MKHHHLRIFFSILFFSLILGFSCTTDPGIESGNLMSDSLYLKNVPLQPGIETWHFIEDLSAPMWTKHAWLNKSPDSNYVNLSGGVQLKIGFDDPKGRLETAYEDLRNFLAAGNVSVDKGDFVIETAPSSDLKGESFKLEINPGSCKIMAGDVEGIRRGIFQIEEEMMSVRGPFLPIGSIEKHPVVLRRISRCVYGPIKRPPAMRDELMDSINYYPDQYMNRLAHDGVNGLWLSVDFRDIVSTKFTPEAGKDAAKRMAKLNRTVAQCLRYGIKIYIFTIEPRSWGTIPPYYMDIDVLKRYPELGRTEGGSLSQFCPSSKTSQQYLYEALNNIFTTVPDLGGMINISYGERNTTCLSTVSYTSPFKGPINCPRCAKKEPWEVLYSSLSAIEKGMHDAAPDAELISWHYMGSHRLAEWVYDIPAHTPKGVILQFQFETGVTKTEFGKNLVGGDYWLATPGPSHNFERQADTARAHGTRVSAKLQTGNSHEIASVPYVPVPSMVYRKFAAMHRLGVSHAMLGWYFGNYPGLMIRPAGKLAFEPLPENEEDFLNKLAAIYWKSEDVPQIVEAWKLFAEGYGNYPLQNMMGYFGPMHDGPVWPLLLKPVDAPLAPTWQISSPTTFQPWWPSGDRIGECLWGGGNVRTRPMKNLLTLKETVELCRRMSTTWDKGVEILNKLEPKYKDESEQLLDIGVAKACGIQFRSAYNILNFYLLREEMLRMEGKERLDILEQLTEIIKDELVLDEDLIELCAKDSRLGFHSEAEGYKYYPEKIRWRMQQLRSVLANDVPEFKKIIRDNELLYPEYTGKTPVGLIAYAKGSSDSIWTKTGFNVPQDLNWQSFGYGIKNSPLTWSATYDKDALYVIVKNDSLINDSASSIPPISRMIVKVEPRRLWPSAVFTSNMGGEPNMEEMRTANESGSEYIITRMEFQHLLFTGEELHPLRVDVRIAYEDGDFNAWCPNRPITSRLVFGKDNPADLGWLMFH